MTDRISRLKLFLHSRHWIRKKYFHFIFILLVILSMAIQTTDTVSNYNSNVLLKVMEHQQFLTDITKQFLSGFKTEVEWANNVQEKTTVLIADVQQIKV
ncbi:unnamed protein product [Rotaria socialis]